MSDFRARAADVFRQAAPKIIKRCDAMHADQSVKGLTGNSATVRKAVRIFNEATAEALDQVLAEAAAAIEHRGRAWNEAMTSIGAALDEHLGTAAEALAPSFRLARTRGPSAEETPDKLISEGGDELRKRLAEFREGWTAPRPKRWIERRPVLYAVALLVLGAIVGAGVTKGTDWLFPAPTAVPGAR